MKRALQILLLSCACGALAQPAQVVVPGGLAEVEGNSSSADLFRTVSTTFQQVYDASAFPMAPSIRIDGMSFRFDGGSGQTFIGFWGFSVILSTTPRSPDALSPRFGDNAGTDSVGVAGGNLGIFAPSSPGVRPFEPGIRFETPFYYNPSMGNLSVAIVTAPGPTALVLDAQLAVGDSVGRVYGDGLSGSVDSLGLVTQFQMTLIPEPSTLVLGVMGASVFVLWSRIQLNKSRWRFPRPH